MRQRFQLLRIGFIGLLSLCMTVGSAQVAPAQSPTLPAAVRSCSLTPTRPLIVRVEQIAQTRFQGRNYYLLAAYSDSGEVVDWVVSIANGRCQDELFNATGDVVSLTQVVGQDVARQLALGRYRHETQRYGRARVQQRVNQSAASPNGIFYPEDVWALRQLGFSVPSRVRVTE